MRLLFKLTSRSRPDNFFRAIDSIVKNVTTNDWVILCTLDSDDITMYNADVYQRIIHLGLKDQLIVRLGKSKNKIDAINRDMDAVKDFDILVNVSDDMVFTAKGFDLKIMMAMEWFFPDLDGFLHFRDTNHNPIDALATMSIIGRNYYELDGYIYHPSYESVWPDNEAMEVAKMRGKYRFINEIIFDHLHPAYGKAPNDAQYKKTESVNVHSRDKNNFDLRKAQGFPK